MGETKMVFVLSVIAAVMYLLMSNYTAWMIDNQISSVGITCGDIDWDKIDDPQTIESIKKSCEGADIPVWFNWIWLIPLGGALGYALIPFVK